MKKLRFGIGLIWVLSLVAGRGTWFPATASPIAATSAEITALTLAPGGEVAGASPVEQNVSPDPRVDLLGNEIEDALADYRIDLGGGVYESHSPDTAVQRLGSPST
jgi:hypothetical protein